MMNQQLKGLVAELYVGEWARDTFSDGLLVENLRMYGVLKEKDEKAIRDVLNGRVSVVLLRLKVDSYLKARCLIMNNRGEAMLINENIKEVPEPTLVDTYKIPQYEPDFGVGFFHTLEDASGVTDYKLMKV
jgi:hypothetical protein